MIRILTGWLGLGGSTVVFNRLANLFDKEIDKTILYGPTKMKWDGLTCNVKDLSELELNKEDIVIYHFLDLKKNLGVKKQILSCHETTLYPVKGRDTAYDAVHFVSQSQKEWQDVDGVVIPNPIGEFTIPKMRLVGNAGVIGSIDRNKRTHLSIQRALDDKMKRVLLYGNITDVPYFEEFVAPLISEKVIYMGTVKDMNAVYQNLSHVYHSPLQETFNLIKFECEAAGVIYDGLEGNDTLAEKWTNEKICEAWKKLLSS